MNIHLGEMVGNAEFLTIDGNSKIEVVLAGGNRLAAIRDVDRCSGCTRPGLAVHIENEIRRAVDRHLTGRRSVFVHSSNDVLKFPFVRHRNDARIERRIRRFADLEFAVDIDVHLRIGADDDVAVNRQQRLFGLAQIERLFKPERRSVFDDDILIKVNVFTLDFDMRISAGGDKAFRSAELA